MILHVYTVLEDLVIDHRDVLGTVAPVSRLVRLTMVEVNIAVLCLVWF